MKKKNKIIFVVLIVSLVLMIILGGSYAFFSYNQSGKKENVINVGNLTFKYSEEQLSNNGIKLLNANPISDSIGINLLEDGYFDFTVEADTSSSGLTYYVLLEEEENNTLPVDCLKLYMTEKNSNDTETAISTSLNSDNSVKSLDKYFESTIPNLSGKVIYSEKVSKGDNNYKKDYRIRMWIRDDIDLTTGAYDEKTASFRINVFALDEVEDKKMNSKLCIRAEDLHTEKCNSTGGQCTSDGYEVDQDIKYGNETYTEGVLTTGDAFTCDINGDYSYDEETERFYYVSTMDNGDVSDSNTAVLIYYNNVVAGNSENYSISYYYSGGGVKNGPETAILQLPKTASNQDSNNATWVTSLKSNVRNITDKNGNIKVSDFSYEGYAARLLTYQEIYNGCYDGTKNISTTTGALVNNCLFLFENLGYGGSNLLNQYWIETLGTQKGNIVQTVFRRLSSAYTNTGGSVANKIAVRPAIEVDLRQIEF